MGQVGNLSEFGVHSSHPGWRRLFQCESFHRLPGSSQSDAVLGKPGKTDPDYLFYLHHCLVREFYSPLVRILHS